MMLPQHDAHKRDRDLALIPKKEPGISFYNACFKIRWSYLLIRELTKRYDNWARIAANSASIEKHEGRFVLTVHNSDINFWPLYTMSADIIHNARNSLDYCWMGLVRASRGLESRRLTFPIARSLDDLEKSIDAAKLGDLSEAAKDLMLRKIQSYRFSDGLGNDLLCALNALSNWQKHNSLPTASSKVLIPEIEIIYHNGVKSIKRNLESDYGYGIEITTPLNVKSIRLTQGVRQDLAITGYPSIENVFIIDALEKMVDESRSIVKLFVETFPESVSFSPDRAFGPGIAGAADETFTFI